MVTKNRFVARCVQPRVLSLIGACLFTHGQAANAQSAPAISQPVSVHSLFAPAGEWVLPDVAQNVEREQALNLFKRVELEDFTLSGFVASRRPRGTPEDLADYRTYLGLGYARNLAGDVALTGRAFYGAGTYSGDNSYVDPESGRLPDEVSAGGASVGNWLGADGQIRSRVFERHAVQAGFEYRQQLEMDLLQQDKVFGRAPTANEGQPLRTMDFVANSEVVLTNDLSLNAGFRFDDAQTAQTSSVDPRVELRYKPQQNATLSAVFDQKNDDAIAGDRAIPLISVAQESNQARNYALAYEQAFTKRNKLRVSAFRYDVDGLLAGDVSAMSSPAQIDATGFEVGVERKQRGIRTNISYAYQQTQSLVGGLNQGSVARRLTKVGMGFPLWARRLSTAVELQYHDIFSPMMGGQAYDYVVGNLTLASGELARDTSLSFGVRDTFKAGDSIVSSPLMPLVPIDGRSLRLDLKRKF